MSNADPKIARLDLRRSKKFLDRLAEDPFLCIVITDQEEGRISIFSKGIGPDQLRRIQEALSEDDEEGTHGEVR